MATLQFDGRKVTQLATRTMMAKRFNKNFMDEQPKALVFVKDAGIYIMSNMTYPKGKTPSSEGEVIYAEGFGEGASYDAMVDAVGGDDFAEYIDAAEVLSIATRYMATQKNGMPKTCKFIIEVHAETMNIYFK